MTAFPILTSHFSLLTSARLRHAANGVIWMIVIAALAATPGCVRRTLTINTDPQGASVILNDQPVGTSPVTVDFTWYGDYDVIVRKEGYETLDTHARIEAPWYQLPPIDFFSEILWPGTITDHQQMSFALAPAQDIDEQQLVEQAIEFRQRTLFGSE